MNDIPAPNRIELPPNDVHNKQLVDYTHPADWTNPDPAPRYNLVVVGAGPAGLVAAAGAAGLGAKVALVERHLMGGDCLIHGCVPSKTLIRSARACAEIRQAKQYGIQVDGPVSVDFPAIMERVRAVRSGLSHHDSAERFQSLGIDVFLGQGAFSGPDMVTAGDKTLRFSKAIIATGARPARPEIEGLTEHDYLTNETIFNLTEQPDRLLILGAGPIGCELAQAYQRLGTQVTLVEMASQILVREDPDAARIVSEALERDGVRFVFDAKVKRVEATNGPKRVVIEQDGQERAIETDALLVGVGRVPNVDRLNLESVQVDYDKRQGIKVDDTLRTTNARIFAAGDVCMTHKFTHAADAAARIVIQNALFGFVPSKGKISALTVPWCTYTDPEIAHVGLSAHEAARRNVSIDTYTIDMADVDRAVCDAEENGLLKVHTTQGKDTIVGATLVARHAGDMISEVTTAMVSGKGLNSLSSVIHPYPTQAEIIKKAADAYKRTRLTPTVAKIMNALMRWQR